MLELTADAPNQTAAIISFSVVGLGLVLTAFVKFIKGERVEATTPLQARLDKAESVIAAAYPVALEALDICPALPETKDVRSRILTVTRILGAPR